MRSGMYHLLLLYHLSPSFSKVSVFAIFPSSLTLSRLIHSFSLHEYFLQELSICQIGIVRKLPIRRPMVLQNYKITKLAVVSFVPFVSRFRRNWKVSKFALMRMLRYNASSSIRTRRGRVILKFLS